MAKTLQTLIKEAWDITDEEFDNAQWVEWFNSGIDDIAPVLYIDEQVQIVNDGTGFPVPANYISTIRLDGVNKNLRQLDPTDDESTGYRVVGGNFVLQNDTATTISLWYYKVPDYLDTSAMTTPLATSVASASRALVFYAAAMSMLREDESDRYEAYMAQYNGAKSDINQRNIKRRAGRSGQWGVIR